MRRYAAGALCIPHTSVFSHTLQTFFWSHFLCSIVIENLFAQVTCVWRATGDGKNLRMGDMDAGDFFTTAVFFANLITLFRGECVRAVTRTVPAIPDTLAVSKKKLGRQSSRRLF